MRHALIHTAVAAGLALFAYGLPQAANASCEDRKMTGTVLGGVGGALIGGSIAHGAGGALLGGLGGAVIGHEVAASGCRRYYYRREARYQREHYYGPAAAGYPQPPAQPMVYYDQYGNPVQPAVTPAAAGAPPGYAGGGCHVEMRAFYDDRGALVQRAVQVCAP